MVDVLGRAEVQVSANITAFDKAMDLLPKKSQEQVKKAMEAIRKEMAETKTAIAGSTGNPAQLKMLSDYYRHLRDSMREIKHEAITMARDLNPANKALGGIGAGGGKRNWGMAAMEASRGFEDLQYGVAGVLNNIPTLVTALGGPAGLAAGISAAAVAAKILYDQWENISQLFGESHVKTAAEEMEELRKKTELTANEAERLARADALKGKVDELRGGKTEAQQSEGSATTRAIVEAGYKDVVSGILAANPTLVDSQGSVPTALADKEKARRYRAVLSESENTQEIKSADEAIQAAERKLIEARQKTAEEIAARGGLPDLFPRAREDLLKMVQANPEKFGPNAKKLMKNLQEANPEAAADKAAQEHFDKVRLENQDREARRIEEERVATRDAIEDIKKEGEGIQAEANARQYGRGEQIAGGLTNRLNTGLLEAIARGKGIDRGVTKANVEAELTRMGVKDAGLHAGKLVDRQTESTDDAIRRRMAEKGGTREEAAAALFGENAARARDEAQRNRPGVGTTNFDSFRQEAQDAILKNGGPNQALIEETRRAVEISEALNKTNRELNETIKAKAIGNGPPVFRK